MNWQLTSTVNYTTVAVAGKKIQHHNQLHILSPLPFSKCCSAELLLMSEIIMCCARFYESTQDWVSWNWVLCSPLNVAMQLKYWMEQCTCACHNYDKHFSFVSCSQGLFFLFLVQKVFHLTCMMVKKLYILFRLTSDLQVPLTVKWAGKDCFMFTHEGEKRRHPSLIRY